LNWLPIRRSKSSARSERLSSGFWSNLPQDVQHHLFEEAVLSQGEAKRQQLAIYLHDEHQRTADALKARAISTPDSLGG
jgi:hypothetical protein